MTILTEILAHKRAEIDALDRATLRAQAEASPVPRDFLAAIRRRPGHGPRLIAELKRASPSKGVMAAVLDLAGTAALYADNGAAAISVLTDEKFFGGTLATLANLRWQQQFPLPLLRKDFIVGEAQLYQSRAAGADAVLLIVAALQDDHQLNALHEGALGLGLTPLVEVHNEAELGRALRLGALRLLGINNRDLKTFKVSLEASERLRPQVPDGIAVVAESGISNRAHVDRMARAGVDAVLVGEALVTASDIGAKVRELTGQSAPVEAGHSDIERAP